MTGRGCLHYKNSGQHHETEGLSALRQQWTASSERGAICIKTAVDSITRERGPICIKTAVDSIMRETVWLH
jgi:hypothetical protein